MILNVTARRVWERVKMLSIWCQKCLAARILLCGIQHNQCRDHFSLECSTVCYSSKMSFIISVHKQLKYIVLLGYCWLCLGYSSSLFYYMFIISWCSFSFFILISFHYFSFYEIFFLKRFLLFFFFFEF